MSLSVIVILGIILGIFIFKDNMNKFHAAIAVLFGIYLGSTVFGGNLREWTDNVFHMISQMNF